MPKPDQTAAFMKPDRPQVYLVGAGCHDVSWLTLAAYQAIRDADVLIYDDLIDPSIVSLANHAKKIYRGKRGHMKSADQSEINHLLVGEARSGRKVVRLKGGDPMIFGRGMEEIRYLEENGIDVRLIPGISSFYGIPAKDQFGLTKRPEAGEFMVLTAHRAKMERSSKEWERIAAFQGTRIFLMGMSEIESIAKNLMKGGLDPQTECAILTSPVFTLTSSLKAPLTNLASKAKEAGLKSPGIIVIGGSVKYYNHKSFARIGLTCSDDFSNKLISLLPTGFQYARLLETVYDDHQIDFSFLFELKNPWLVLTSVHGVSCFFHQLQRQNIDLRRLSHCRFAAIGLATAKEMEKHGIYPDLKGDGNSASLSETLQNALNPTQNDKDIVLLQSDQALPVLTNTLSPVARVKFVPLYDFACKPTSATSANVRYDYLVLASRTAAKAWLKLEKPPVIKRFVCLSNDIAKIISTSYENAQILIADSSSPKAILDRIWQDQLDV